MSEKLQSVKDSLSGLAEMPEQVSRHVETLANSAAGRKFRQLDASTGRLVSRAKAFAWVAGAAVAGAMAYTGWSVTSGWVQIFLTCIPAAVAAWALWYANSHLRQPTTASAILIEEIEDRVKPARWILLGLRKLFGFGRKTSER